MKATHRACRLVPVQELTSVAMASMYHLHLYLNYLIVSGDEPSVHHPMTENRKMVWLLHQN